MFHVKHRFTLKFWSAACLIGSSYLSRRRHHQLRPANVKVKRQGIELSLTVFLSASAGMFHVKQLY